MLTVQPFGAPSPPSRKTLRAGIPGFHLPDSEAASAASESAATAPTAPPSPAPRDTGAVHDREARQHGTDMLDLLAEVQRDLLGAADNPQPLQRLARLCAQMPAAANPALRATLRQIATSAQVELARREVAQLAPMAAPDA